MCLYIKKKQARESDWTIFWDREMFDLRLSSHSWSTHLISPWLNREQSLALICIAFSQYFVLCNAVLQLLRNIVQSTIYAVSSLIFREVFANMHRKHVELMIVPPFDLHFGKCLCFVWGQGNVKVKWAIVACMCWCFLIELGSRQLVGWSPTN